MRLLLIFYSAFAFFFLSASAQIDSTLLSAVRTCDLRALQERSNGKIDINARDQNRANLLTWAVYYCDLPIVKYLVNHGATVSDSAVIYINEETGYFGSLQGIAARKGKIELLKYLADSLGLSLNEKEFSPYSRKKEGWTPLTAAVTYGHSDVVRYLMQKNAQIDVLDAVETSTPLIKAAESEQWKIFKLLMSAEANKKKFGSQAEVFVRQAVALTQPFAIKTRKELKVKQFILELRKAYFGEYTVGYATGLNQLAVALENTGGYKETEEIYRKAIALLKRVSREDHPQHIRSLNGLAFTYYNTAHYENALSLLEQAHLIIRKIYPQDNVNDLNVNFRDSNTVCCSIAASWPCAYNLALQALMYAQMGKYDKAFPLYRHALAITKREMGEGHENNAFILNNFAYLYTRMGLYKEAISLYQETVNILKGIPRQDVNDQYAATLFDLAHAYCQLGQYKDALPLFEKALPIIEKSFGAKHEYYGMNLDGLAFTYEHIGEHNKAISFHQRVLKIYKEALGEVHPRYANSLNNLATLYLHLGDYNKALSFYQQALTVRKNALKEDHPDYAQTLKNLAVVYERKGANDTALLLYQKALTIIKKAVGEDHHYYASCLANLASLYLHIGRKDSALHLNQQALSINKKRLGDEYPGNVSLLNSLGLLYVTSGNEIEGTAAFIDASNLQLRHLSRTNSILSEEEKINFVNKEVHQFDYLPSLFYLKRSIHPSLLQQLYTNQLALKGMVLEDQQQVLKDIRQSSDNTALLLYNQWQFNKAFVGKQLLLPIRERISYLHSLLEITNQQEQQLSRISLAFNEQQRKEKIAATQVAQKLKKEEAAVEFIRFQLYNNKRTDSIIYAAMLLLPGDTVPRFIALCEEKQLFRLLRKPGGFETDDLDIEELYGDDQKAGKLSDSVYQLVWEPLDIYLQGIHTVYYAPVGLLHRIAFQALRPDATRFLIDKYRLNQVVSTRSVAIPLQVSTTFSSAAIWGNINYSIDKSVVNQQINSGQNVKAGKNAVDTSAFSFNFYNSDTRGFRGGGWDSLPASRKEMETLQNLFFHAGISIATFSGSLATEESFKALNGKSAGVLHLATHGFFLPVAEHKTKSNNEVSAGNAFKVQANPMFRSGLILAGGNHAWKGEPAIPGKEDGILTAYEIAQVDLSKTDLVVLSGCETGLGDLKGTEGVIGLQRGFKLAGVKQMLMTFWSVYDQPTMELMVLFYHNRLRGQATREALRNAQLKIREKYPEPYFWAAFVIIE